MSGLAPAIPLQHIQSRGAGQKIRTTKSVCVIKKHMEGNVIVKQLKKMISQSLNNMRLNVHGDIESGVEKK